MADVHMHLQVAESMLRGLEAGQYLLPTPDVGADFFLKSCLVPCSPRPFSLIIDMMLAPLYVLLQWSVTKKAEAAARRHCVYQENEKSQDSSDQASSASAA